MTKIVIRPRDPLTASQPGTASRPPEPPGAAPVRTITFDRRKFWLAAGLAGLLLLATGGLLLQKTFFAGPSGAVPVPGKTQSEAWRGPGKAAAPNGSTGDPLGFDPALYDAAQDILTEDVALAAFFKRQKVAVPVVLEWAQQAESLGVESFEKQHEVLTLTPKNGASDERKFVYKMSAQKSIIFSNSPLPEVKVQLRTLETRLRAAGGIIRTTLWEAVLDYNIHHRVIEQMEEAMKWSVDFFHLAPGDKFKVVYEEKRVGDEVVGIGRIKAVYFKTGGEEESAYRIEGISAPGFYDAKGNPVRRSFLRCPVKYERITSAYNPDRIHPVLGVKRAHLGTDFAASKGTPVFSVADGTIEEAGFRENNGNYVKIRHDKIYETQYLHFDRIADGIRPGRAVKQGDVIGYAGETGLATGPHVCFRFWKNGQQVDPREEKNLETNSYMTLADQDRFIEQKDALARQLRGIVYFDGKI